MILSVIIILSLLLFVIIFFSYQKKKKDYKIFNQYIEFHKKEKRIFIK